MNKRILVVDDDPQLVDSLRDILEEAGYIVYTASTGSGAIGELHRGSVDLVLLDYNLPDGRGMDWAAQFPDINAHMKVLLMTGMAEQDLPPMSGVNGYISKPIAPPDLLLRIHQTLL